MPPITDILIKLFGESRMVLAYPAGDGKVLRTLKAHGIPAVSLEPDAVRTKEYQASDLHVWQGDWTGLTSQDSKFDGVHVDLDHLTETEQSQLDAVIRRLASCTKPKGLLVLSSSTETDHLSLILPQNLTLELESPHLLILRRLPIPQAQVTAGFSATSPSACRLGQVADTFISCENVLELGSGQGHFLDALRVRDIAGHGLETDPQMAALCESRGLRITRDASKLLDSETIDGVYIGHTLNSLSAGDAAKALALCQSMMRRQAQLALRFDPRSVDLADLELTLGTLGFKTKKRSPLSTDKNDCLLLAILEAPSGRAQAQGYEWPQISTSTLPVNQPPRDLYDLERFERRVNSQGGEDGIIDAIFAAIGTTNRYYVEFGCGDGVQCNTANLHKQGWCGLLMDGMETPLADDVVIHREWISRDNINQLFEKHGVPDTFDILSIDIDGNDYWVLDAIQSKPRVIVAEYNANLGPHHSLAMPYDEGSMWDGTDYYGASLQALVGLLEPKGYKLIYCNQAGVNAFFVDAVHVPQDGPDTEAIYRPPNYWYRGYRQPPNLSRSLLEV